MNNIESILKCLIENLDEGIHIVDKNGNTLYYNNSMGRIEGISPGEILGKRAFEFLKGVEEESSTLMNALKNREQYVDVIQNYSSNHGKKITSINTTVPAFYNGEVIGAVEISKDITQLKELNEKLCKLQGSGNTTNKYYTFDDIIGQTESIKAVINKAQRASFSNSSVLIYGETGVGKEVFAQSIHHSGARKDKPYVPINCAAIPSSLLESMLFGTVKGSFTGAEDKKGLFIEANGGTILLDEINSMDTALQSKLLRVLQDGYIRPLGSNAAIDVDVRIIASLNEEPEKLIREGKLRKDFYYRLSVVRIDVPPLKERKEDIKEFCLGFIDYYNKLLGKQVEDIEESVLTAFNSYDWPGNIRELKNVIESAMNMVDNSRVLTKEYFENKIITSKIMTKNPEVHYDLKNKSLEEYIDMIEAEIIKESLLRYNCNISKTAQELKMTRQNLQYKIKKYKLP
ncbi:sigma-54 interaction domain-containing protein [Clostridium omnivorum]|uniref:Sigma-54-dependent Fis family transcriptional regulator n=1 Tax=Clostridium omnivorum TaxID=1604902 RepID=A0ABQ5N093_9CLOT|nr:sigma 54-interacting transcriptional regulator [Clostridium sp. E14]GLC28617.1 sigma-54-dependent Fis family transcriptional regulator [Clostridium sp. E14]